MRPSGCIASGPRTGPGPVVRARAEEQVMVVREPWVAGTFYPADPAACRREAREYLSRGRLNGNLPADPIGGIVPHAGWRFSGAICGKVLGYLASKRSPQTIVFTGTVHVPEVRYPSTMTMGTWRTPVGDMDVDCEFAQRLVATGLVQDFPQGFVREHSIEVPLPMTILAFPRAWLVPLMVPPTVSGVELGQAVAEVGRALGRDLLLLASSDLTHYGPNYGFTPVGLGEPALQWTRTENDRAILEAIERLEAERIVPMVAKRRNACGPAAIATVLAGARQLGAQRGYILEYATSHDVLPMGPPDNFVGYVGAVLG